MKDCKVSDDGAVWGDEDRVREYERKQEDPLSGMKFPYSTDTMGFISDSGGHKINISCVDSRNARQRAALVAFANLAPLIDAWYHDIKPSTPNINALSIAYGKALEVARKVNG